MGRWDPPKVGGSVGGFANKAKDNPATTIGAVAGSAAGPAGAAIGGYIGSQFDGAARDKKGAHEAEARQRDIQEDQYEWNKGTNEKYTQKEGKYLENMETADRNFRTQRNKAVDPQIQNLEKLQAEADAQANDSRVVYEGSIKPAAMQQMNRAQAEAGSAMSLKDYMDPNNQVAKGTRDLYDTQAQNVGRQGLADTGVMQAMGANAASQAFGAGGPMSTGQLQSLYAANQSQAGRAYANTQRQMQSLRDQGLNQGFIQSDKAYQAGERAGGRASDTIRDVSNLDAANIQKQSGLRGERGSLGGGIMDINAGVAQSDYDISRNRTDRNLDMGYRDLDRQSTTENTRYGMNAQQEANMAARKYGSAQASQQTLGAMIGAAGTIGGAIAGGPAGAAIGGAAGGAIGQGVANQGGGNPYAYGQAQQPQPQYGNYNYGGR